MTVGGFGQLALKDGKLKTCAISCFGLVLTAALLSCAVTPGHSRDRHDDSLNHGSRRSIGGWVSCNGASDDTSGVTKAFAAASHGAFTLVVDCPVRLKVGMDISRSVFIDDGTTVEFTGEGKFTVDNVFIPAFVIADSSRITLTDWNVEYDASLPVQPTKAANAFNDQRVSGWLAARRAVVFDKRQGDVHSPWVGPTNTCAVFYITGDSSNLNVTGMRLTVPAAAGGDRFIPVAFSLGINLKGNQTVTAKMPVTVQSFAIPHDLTFSNITLDGTYMGWVGALQNAVFENVHSERYGDLQDAAGQNVGGVGKWFAPPHLFYFGSSPTGDTAFFNRNIRISNVRDDGIRIGRARDAGGTDTISGYALSLKLGCIDCSVDNYLSARPDGFMDVLPSDGLAVSNVTASYDSGFLNNLFPGWRFPSSSYKNVKFENITFTDTAPITIQNPIGNSAQASNQGIVFKNVRVELNRWAGAAGTPLPAIAGQTNDLSMEYRVKVDGSHFARSQTAGLEVTLQAVPATSPAGAALVLTWASRQATNCSGSGAWSGSLGTAGSRTVMAAAAGRDFTITCQNGGTTSASTLHMVPAS
jgi:hypothetical protein